MITIICIFNEGRATPPVIDTHQTCVYCFRRFSSVHFRCVCLWSFCTTGSCYCCPPFVHPFLFNVVLGRWQSLKKRKEGDSQIVPPPPRNIKRHGKKRTHVTRYPCYAREPASICSSFIFNFSLMMMQKLLPTKILALEKKGSDPFLAFYKRLDTAHLLTLLRWRGKKKLWLHKRGGV